jgi:hypothetical protein
MSAATSASRWPPHVDPYDSFATVGDVQSGLLLGFHVQNCCENAGEYTVNTRLLKSQLLCQLS